MKRDDFEKFRKRHSLSDEWWVSVDNEVRDRLYSLDQIAELEYECPGQSIALMHPDCVDDQQSEWVPFEFEGISNLKSVEITSEATDGSENLQLHRKVELVGEQVSEMKLAIGELQAAFNKLEGLMTEALSLKQLKTDLEQRQRFIEDGEEALLAKTIRYEEQLAELEQIRENFGDLDQQTA